MKDYNSNKYKQSFLDQVIIRIDFLQFLNTEDLFCSDIEKSILKLFPRRGIYQKIRLSTLNVAIDSSVSMNPSTREETQEGLLREYQAGQNKILLSNKFIVFEIKDYDLFDTHYQEVNAVLSSIYSKMQITTARVGIRYINLFDSDKLKICKNMFSKEISEILSTKKGLPKTSLKLIRSMNISEYQVSDMVLKFRYGMFNPDYPNPLNKNSFALDYDCYITDPLESVKEILDALLQGHEAIQELFENSITDNLRKLLNHE